MSANMHNRSLRCSEQRLDSRCYFRRLLLICQDKNTLGILETHVLEMHLQA
jgi:hypothetical protein